MVDQQQFHLFIHQKPIDLRSLEYLSDNTIFNKKRKFYIVRLICLCIRILFNRHESSINRHLAVTQCEMY
jgi:hypothetical protein